MNGFEVGKKEKREDAVGGGGASAVKKRKAREGRTPYSISTRKEEKRGGIRSGEKAPYFLSKKELPGEIFIEGGGRCFPMRGCGRFPGGEGRRKGAYNTHGKEGEGKKKRVTFAHCQGKRARVLCELTSEY